MNEADSHPEIHKALYEWYQARASYYNEMAKYHAIKAANPLCDIPIPEKSAKCDYPKISIDLG